MDPLVATWMDPASTWLVVRHSQHDGMRLLHANLGRRSQGGYPLHRHAHQEWHFVVAGPCSFRIGQRRMRVTGGDGFVIPPGVLHHVLLDEPGDRIVQYIAGTLPETPEEETLPQAFAARAGERGCLQAGAAMHGLLAEAARLDQQSDRLAYRAIECAFTAFVCRLAAGGTAAPSEALHRALEHMRHHLATGVSVVELARQARLTPGHLTRLFRQQLGVTPSQHFLHLRMSLADELLSRPGATVAGVAAAVGYDDPFHFSRRFRRWSGQPPSRRLAAQ